MNKIVIAIVIIVILVAGAVLLLGKNTSTTTTTSQQPTATSTPMAMPTGSTTPTSSVSPTSGQTTVSPAAMGAQDVVIQNFAFSPATLHVKIGDKVTWTNKDSVGHSATADDGSFDTGVLAQGKSGSVTFKKAGTYTYHCSVHPNMKGTIVVE